LEENIFLLEEKRIDYILELIEKGTLKKETLAGCVIKKVNQTVIIAKEY
jgi:tRNA(Ile)-lysidine synthase